MSALPGALPGAVEPDPDRYVLPAALTSEQTGRGPRFSDEVWNVRAFLPRTNHRANLMFTGLADHVALLAAKQFLESRLTRSCPVGSSAWAVRPMKITGAFKELDMFAAWLAALRDLGIQRLSDVRQHHLDTVKRSWQNLVLPGTVAARITVLQHVAAHAAFMTADKLTFMPWSGRPATQVAKRERADENVTPRIPEPIMAPMLRAALFYIESASDDILAARTMLEDLKRNPPAPCRSTGEAAARIRAYIQHLRGAGKGIPALPREQAHLRPGAPIVENVVQAPNLTLVCTLSGTRSTFHHKQLVEQAGRELGYQEGGLDCRIAAWPDTGRPWRAGFNPYTVEDETHHLRTAAWLVIAYLSGMRDAEIRELGRVCAFTAPGDDGRVRHKLRGRVFKGRKLTGDVAEWVVLDVVHRAVHVLQQINTDPTHLFGYQSAGQSRFSMVGNMPTRLSRFRDHVNSLFGTTEAPYIPSHQVGTPNGQPEDGDEEPAPELPWHFDTLQFRRILSA